MSKMRDIVKAQAAIWRTELDSYGLSAWEKDLDEFSESDVKEAFGRHRRDNSMKDGRMRGEFWPMPAVILNHLAEIRRERSRFDSTTKISCPDPECSSGWVLAYRNDKGVPYVKRCQQCHSSSVTA
jgi:hypothetical protein